MARQGIAWPGTGHAAHTTAIPRFQSSQLAFPLLSSSSLRRSPRLPPTSAPTAHLLHNTLDHPPFCLWQCGHLPEVAQMPLRNLQPPRPGFRHPALAPLPIAGNKLGRLTPHAAALPFAISANLALAVATVPAPSFALPPSFTAVTLATFAPSFVVSANLALAVPVSYTHLTLPTILRV